MAKLNQKSVRWVTISPRMAQKTLVFFGASAIPLKIGAWAVENGWDTTIAANSVQMQKKVNGITLEQASQAKGIQTFIAEKGTDLKPESLNVDADTAVFISVGSPWIFNESVLDRFKHRVMNLHGTHLPKYRGGTLFSWQILTGQRTGMCLLHQMTAGIDDGPVLSYEEFIYPAQCRLPKDFIAVYEQKNTEFTIDFLAKYTGHLLPQGQPEYLSTYWPRLRADVHGWINWDWTNTEIERQICAFDDPYGGARCRFQNKTVIIREAWAQSTDGYTHPFQHGLVYRNNGKWLSVAAKGGELLICSITDEEGNSMMDKIQAGDRLFTSPDDLMLAKQRVVKSAQGLVLQHQK